MFELTLQGKLVAGAALPATVAFVAAAALAQATNVGGVTVTAPRTIGRDPAGAAIERVSMSQRVRTSDLDLRTRIGAAELDKRIASAARTMCRQLESLYPVGAPDAQTCARRSVRASQKDATAAKARARRG